MSVPLCNSDCCEVTGNKTASDVNFLFLASSVTCVTRLGISDDDARPGDARPLRGRLISNSFFRDHRYVSIHKVKTNDNISLG